MSEVNFIVREPLLDPKQRVIGYELTWQSKENNQVIEKPGAVDLEALVEFYNGQPEETESVLGSHLLFLEATSDLLKEDAFSGLPPKNTILTLRGDELADAETLSAVQVLHEEGFGIALRDVDSVVEDKTALSLMTHVAVPFASDRFVSQVNAYDVLAKASIRIVARQVVNWDEYDSCAALDLDTFIGKLHLTARAGKTSKGLNPAQAMILQLMQMVRKNVDVRQLEDVLKHDAALSYKLLRYINSAGFGRSEIQSLRHAVTMLGYLPLYRWLALLLATASTSGSPVLMQTAAIRGRFVELLGHDFLPKNEAENLFVAGMFSLLDRLLGVSMQEVLDNLKLSEAMSQALLSRQGVYGGFLALAEACELNNGLIGELADAVGISVEAVNEAHLSAIVWAQNLKI
jgi:c-di-GMP-related signal transduction protein